MQKLEEIKDLVEFARSLGAVQIQWGEFSVTFSPNITQFIPPASDSSVTEDVNQAEPPDWAVNDWEKPGFDWGTED